MTKLEKRSTKKSCKWKLFGYYNLSNWWYCRKHKHWLYEPITASGFRSRTKW